MENKKLIWGGLAGGVAFFLLGWLLYGLLMKSFLAEQTTEGVFKDIPDFPYLIIGNIVMGFLYTIVICNWAKASSAMDGAKKGFLFALILGVGMDLTMLGTSNIMTMSGAFADIIVTVIMGTVVGAVVTAVAGMNQAAKAA